MKRMGRAALLALIIGGMCAPQQSFAAAKDDAPPADKRPAKEDDPSKFFWFHKDGADPVIAENDIRYCFIQTSTIWARQNPSSGQGGLIGALVEGIIKGITEGVEARRMRDAGMRKCMGLYGFTRYKVPEPQWNEMMRAPDSVKRLTAFATGAAPTTERLDP
jgi:hypothetical protein